MSTKRSQPKSPITNTSVSTQTNTSSSSDAKPKTKPVLRAVTQPPPADLSDELIAQRAYAIWQRRGCPVGQDGQSDWFAARAELEQERAQPSH